MTSILKVKFWHPISMSDWYQAHCNTTNCQRTAKTLQRTAIHGAVSDWLQARRNTTHCNKLQHSAIHCNTLQPLVKLRHTRHYRNNIKHTAKQHISNTLQHTATPCKLLQHATLQHTAPHCNTATHGAVSDWHQARGRVRLRNQQGWWMWLQVFQFAAHTHR